MQKFTTIPEGYRFTFVSYEGDADNYQTIITEGLPQREAQLVGELAKLLIDGGSGLENQYEPSENVYERAYAKIFSIFEKYQDVFEPQYFELFKPDLGGAIDYINENILGSSDVYTLRVLKSYKVEYVAQDIHLEDVTLQFQ